MSHLERISNNNENREAVTNKLSYEEARPFQEVLRDFIDEIEWQSLEEIFLEVLAKSGLNRREAGLTKNIIKDQLPSAEYTQASFRKSPITIAISEQKFAAYEKGIEKVRLLKAIIHEEVHATAAALWTQASGYSRGKNFNLFNEAITERLALEITRTYIKRTGFEGGLALIQRKATEKEGDVAQEEELENADVSFDQIFGQFIGPRHWLEGFITKLSEYAEVDESVVWQALIRGNYERENLKDFAEFFDEIYYPRFTAHLKNARVSNDLPTETPIDESWRIRLRKAILGS
jgi:hypothetical protein